MNRPGPWWAPLAAGGLLLLAGSCGVSRLGGDPPSTSTSAAVATSSTAPASTATRPSATTASAAPAPVATKAAATTSPSRATVDRHDAAPGTDGAVLEVTQQFVKAWLTPGDMPTRAAGLAPVATPYLVAQLADVDRLPPYAGPVPAVVEQLSDLRATVVVTVADGNRARVVLVSSAGAWLATDVTAA